MHTIKPVKSAPTAVHRTAAKPVKADSATFSAAVEALVSVSRKRDAAMLLIDEAAAKHTEPEVVC